MSPPRYVIINDFDAPDERMVCQWVDGVGYCYLNRSGSKPRHDGMRACRTTTPIEAFGFVHSDNPDGTVSFYRTTRAPTATYPDGEPRRWQGRLECFEYERLTRDNLKQKRPAR